jgi:2-polyprenyl-3-methyl-5-hydroxy-6-metoxy-1,4-benzoquinol methylase
MSVKTFSKQPSRQESAEEVRCAVCGAADYRLAWEGPEYRFVRCSSCGVLYQNPQPRQDDLTLRYDEEYFRYERENEEAFYGLMVKALQDVRFYREVEPRFKAGRFLDVGCATGRLLAALRERGWQVAGVEVCVPSAEFARRERGLSIHTVPLEQAEISEESVAVVHASHLIEHLSDPGRFVAQARRILQPGGELILTTPNSDGLQARLFGEQWRSLIPDHVYLFSRSTLRQLLERHGFAVQRVKTWGGLARGLAPAPIKSIFDRAAKTLSFGDVMVMRARKQSA